MPRQEPVNVWKLVIVGALSVLLVVAFSVGGCAGIKAFSRAQKRADANNNVRVTAINIRRTQQQVQVQRQLAQVKIAEAQGIARAQQIIDGTLTPLYIQHEAIQAQQAMVNSPNHTEVYVPTGANGVPLVFPTGPQAGQFSGAGKR